MGAAELASSNDGAVTGYEHTWVRYLFNFVDLLNNLLTDAIDDLQPVDTTKLDKVEGTRNPVDGGTD